MHFTELAKIMGISPNLNALNINYIHIYEASVSMINNS